MPPLYRPLNRPDVTALLDPEQVNPAMIHGGMAPQIGAQMGVPGAAQLAMQPALPQAMSPPMARPMPQPLRQSAPVQASMAQGAATLPVAPLATAPTQAPAAGGGPPSSPNTPEQLHDDMRNMVKSKFDEMGITVDDQRLEELTNFAVAKRQGRMAKSMDKKSKAALAKYFSVLVGQQHLEEELTTKLPDLQRNLAAAIEAKDPQKELEYKDQAKALKMKAEAHRAKVTGYADIIKNKYHIDSKYLANPVSLFAFINDDTDHDYSDVMADDETP